MILACVSALARHLAAAAEAEAEAEDAAEDEGSMRASHTLTTPSLEAVVKMPGAAVTPEVWESVCVRVRVSGDLGGDDV